MQALRLHAPGDLRLEEVPVPVLGPHDVLCQVLRAGVCSTDLAIYSGEFSGVATGAVKFPFTPGHEWSGTVSEVGSAVTRFRPGDRVVGDTWVACGQCYSCLMGTGRCLAGRAVGTVNAWDGAWAEFLVMPERHLFALPESVNFLAGALVEPAATALYAVRQAEVGIGDTVLVLGSGPLGLFAARWAKLCGASHVMLTGRKEFKLNLGLRLGADQAINTTREDLADTVRAAVGPEGVDRVIEASGAPELFLAALDLVRVQGTISLVAFYEHELTNFQLDAVPLRSITVRGAGGSLGMYEPTLRMMATGAFDPTPILTGAYPRWDAEKALTFLASGSPDTIKLILEP